jgi:hypothetical protein
MKKLFVIFASVALIAAFAVTATAADWSLYGNARMATFMTDQDFGDPTFNNAVGDNDDDDLIFDLQGNSRIGATVKNENISARFEYGTGINLRRLYGTYDFGSAKLKIGQDYTPVSQFISGQVFDGDLGLLGVGTFYGLRRQQISVAVGDFEIAFIRPASAALAGATVGQDVDEETPCIEAKWGMSTDMFNFNIRGGWQTYDVDFAAGGLASSESVDSTVIAVDGGVNFGPLYVKAAVSQGTNIGVPWFGYSETDPAPGFFGYANGVPAIDPANGDLVEVDTLQYALVVGFKVNDTMTLEAGYGYKEDDPDDLVGVPTQEDDMTSFYAQLVWQIAPGLFLIPEFGMFDYGDTGVNIPNGGDSGDLTYYGAKWQVNF